MPYTYRQSSTWEIALATQHGADHAGGERMKPGDIIAVEVPGGSRGTAEVHAFVWLLVYGLDDNQMVRLNDPLYAAYLDMWEPDWESVRYDKRRFCLPLARLAQRCPFFESAAAQDPTVIHQPFLPVDTDGYYYRFGSEEQPVHGLPRLPRGCIAHPALHVRGLVYDKLQQRYL